MLTAIGHSPGYACGIEVRSGHEGIRFDLSKSQRVEYRLILSQFSISD
ncbi:hypothetical protein CEV31_4382 [Brucella thiophenivorans]|uniref:Uncharacterized protein n=1 Tax=Brucella thiophenivorans TaxID=571255 RepID=A0A256FQV2_9HYPH|nr:hypothetical protein CEV31_4382 [Brucella thiophenivorans]